MILCKVSNLQKKATSFGVFALGAVCGLLLGSVIGTLLGHDSVSYLRRMTQRLLGPATRDVNFEIFVQ